MLEVSPGFLKLSQPPFNICLLKVVSQVSMPNCSVALCVITFSGSAYMQTRLHSLTQCGWKLQLDCNLHPWDGFCGPCVVRDTKSVNSMKMKQKSAHFHSKNFISTQEHSETFG